MVAAAALSTFLLSYQVAIWLATDAPLLAAVSIALLGAHLGFYADSSAERVRGYLLMHAALGLGFLCKSAAAWMVPALAIVTLVIWEKRWRELLRWELYAGLLIQAAIILSWVWFVYHGSDGLEHLKVFFWNNLAGRFAAVDAPPELQYAAAHRNSPGKYLIELPMYLLPWTLLVIAAARQAWRQRRSSPAGDRTVRFALAASLPALLVLSLAATARNIYLAPALPGVALLLAWWAREILPGPDLWDVRALRGTACFYRSRRRRVCGGTRDRRLRRDEASWIGNVCGDFSDRLADCNAVGGACMGGGAQAQVVDALWALLLAYCALLIGPASQLYTRVDGWQDLAQIARAVQVDTAGKPLVLLAPDETTRAIIDMYARTSAARVDGPIDAAWIDRVRSMSPRGRRTVSSSRSCRARPPQLPWRAQPKPPLAPPWFEAANLQWIESYALPNGRRYALLGIRRQSNPDTVIRIP